MANHQEIPDKYALQGRLKVIEIFHFVTTEATQLEVDGWRRPHLLLKDKL